ncbi:MAG: hypothetical protein VXY17_02570 [Verrucomicrobiota bacterium]|nr:hypothetical protein [Verrucomicrobiota bacterium]
MNNSCFPLATQTTINLFPNSHRKKGPTYNLRIALMTFFDEKVRRRPNYKDRSNTIA